MVATMKDIIQTIRNQHKTKLDPITLVMCLKSFMQSHYVPEDDQVIGQSSYKTAEAIATVFENTRILGDRLADGSYGRDLEPLRPSKTSKLRSIVFLHSQYNALNEQVAAAIEQGVETDIAAYETLEPQDRAIYELLGKNGMQEFLLDRAVELARDLINNQRRLTHDTGELLRQWPELYEQACITPTPMLR